MSDITIELIAAYAVSVCLAFVMTFHTNRKLKRLRTIQLELGVEKHLVPKEITWYSNRGAINWAKNHRSEFNGEKARLIESALLYERVGFVSLLLPVFWITIRILTDG